MPWKSTSPEVEQIRFIERWESGGETFLELCRVFGVSRKTGYKRVHRFQAWGWDGRPEPGTPPASESNGAGGSGALDRGPAKALDLGSQETGGLAGGPGALGSLASPQHSWGPAGPGRAGAPAQGTPPRGALEPTLCPSGAAQRPVVYRLQGLVSNGGWGAGRPPYRGGRLLPVSPGVPRAAPASGVGSAPGSGEGLSGVRPSPGHPHRQRPSLCQRGNGGTVVPGRLVGQAGDPPRAHQARTSGTERALGATPSYAEGGDSQSAPAYVAEAAACLPRLSFQLQPRETHEALDQQPPARRYRPSVRPYSRRVDSPEYESGTTCDGSAPTDKSSGRDKWST